MLCGSPFRVHRILRSGPPNMLCSAGAIAIVADVLVPNITVLVSGHQQLLHWFDREHDASWIMLCNIRIITLQPWNKIYSRKVGRLSHNDKLRYFQCGQSSCHDNSWWRHQMETFLRYWPFVRGIHRSPVVPITNFSDTELWCFDLRLNKRFSKQPRDRWFGTPSRPLWRHCNVSFFQWLFKPADAGVDRGCRLSSETSGVTILLVGNQTIVSFECETACALWAHCIGRRCKGPEWMNGLYHNGRAVPSHRPYFVNNLCPGRIKTQPFINQTFYAWTLLTVNGLIDFQCYDLGPDTVVILRAFCYLV